MVSSLFNFSSLRASGAGFELTTLVSLHIISNQSNWRRAVGTIFY